MKDQHFDEEDDVNLLQQVKHFFFKGFASPQHDAATVANMSWSQKYELIKTRVK